LEIYYIFILAKVGTDFFISSPIPFITTPTDPFAPFGLNTKRTFFFPGTPETALA